MALPQFVAGVALTAAELNAMLAEIQPAWTTTFDPVVGQGGGTPAITHTLFKSQWHYDGDMVEFECYIGVTGPGTAGQILAVTLPIAALSSTNGSMGAAGIFDGSANLRYVVTPRSVAASTTSIQFYADGAGVWGVTPSLAIANTDEIYFTIRYRWR